MIKDVEKTIRDYIAQVIHVSLATCFNNQPWVCEVHYAYDQDLNLYFRSLQSTRHSQEIAQNPNVAGNIVEPHGLTDKPRGVYFEGKAELLDDVKPSDKAVIALNDRFNLGQEVLDEARSKDGHKIYKISVSKFYLFDTRESTPSRKYELPWAKF
ncbi:MAG TPA: pyridoxamine 5'-phosphate oxidase family protein [Candidatus Saccharimonadales bacterium]|nr:pyridoxamine 5'-phosphate oxidase family protein [Candidatus Saccharimonadales bacterium]